MRGSNPGDDMASTCINQESRVASECLPTLPPPPYHNLFFLFCSPIGQHRQSTSSPIELLLVQSASAVSGHPAPRPSFDLSNFHKEWVGLEGGRELGRMLGREAVEEAGQQAGQQAPPWEMLFS